MKRYFLGFVQQRQQDPGSIRENGRVCIIKFRQDVTEFSTWETQQEHLYSAALVFLIKLCTTEKKYFVTSRGGNCITKKTSCVETLLMTCSAFLQSCPASSPSPHSTHQSVVLCSRLRLCLHVKCHDIFSESSLLLCLRRLSQQHRSKKTSRFQANRNWLRWSIKSKLEKCVYSNFVSTHKFFFK